MMRIALFLLLASGPLVRAGPLEEALVRLHRAAPDDRAAALQAVLDLKPTVAAVHAWASAETRGFRGTPGWHEGITSDAAGAKRPFHFYVPKKVAESDKPAPLWVDLHGGVGRRAFIKPNVMGGFRAAIVEEADRLGFVFAMPLGRSDCMWWTDAGVDHIRKSIRHIRGQVPVDDTRIVGSGFSDGASGGFYLAMADPEPFAAFLCMNGHPAVASSASRRQVYPRNVRHMPLFVAMTQDDVLYPAHTVLPHLKTMMRGGASLPMLSYPKGGHQPVYFRPEQKRLVGFMMAARRRGLNASLDWQCAEPGLGRLGWIEVLDIGAAEGDAKALPDTNVMSEPGRVRIGVQLGGEGLSISRVVEESVAAAMGMRVGDRITAIDKKPVADFGGLRAALGKKSYGDTILVDVDRNGETLRLNGRFPPFKPRPIYLRAKPTARVAVDAFENEVDVVSRNVRRLRLLLSPKHFDLEKEIVVRVNGKERWRGKAVADVKWMLERYARDADTARLFAAKVDVAVPAPSEAAATKK